MTDLFYDVNGQYCGPKYWDSEVQVNDDNNYVIYAMKRDEPMYDIPVFLDPAGDPDADPNEGYGGPVRPVLPA